MMPSANKKGICGGVGKSISALRSQRVARRWTALILTDVAGWSLKKVRREVQGATKARIDAWRDCFVQAGTLEDKERVSRSKISEQDLTAIKASITSGTKKRLSLRRAVAKTAGKHGVTLASRESYRRQLPRGPDPWIPQRERPVKHLTSKHLAARKAFCSSNGRSIAADTMFSDSKYFFGEWTAHSKAAVVWAPAGKPPVRARTQHADYKVHAYAGITRHGATDLIFTAGTTPDPTPRSRTRRPRGAVPAAPADPPKSVSAAVYASEVLPALLSAGDAMFIGERWRFQQDGARAHTVADTAAGHVNRALIAAHARLIEPWPARSPDLSPIEKAWAISEQHLWSAEHLLWSDIVSFKAALRQAWREAITPEVCKGLFAGIRNTYAVCSRGGGDNVTGWGRKTKMAAA